MNLGTLKPILVITVAALAVALSLADSSKARAGGVSGGPGILSDRGGAGMVSPDAEAVGLGGATAPGTGQLATVSSAQVQFDSLFDRIRDIGYTWFKESLKAATSPYIDWRSLLKLKPEIENTMEIIETQQREQLIEMWYEELRTTPIDEVVRMLHGTGYLEGLSPRELKTLLKERAEEDGIEVK